MASAVADAPVKPKVEDDSSDDDVPLADRKTEAPKEKPAPAVKEADVKEEKKDEAKVKKEKKEVKPRKTYDLAGQTKEPPPETDSLRMFYTSLHEQRPDSDMALAWCMQHGLLSADEAEKAYKKIKGKTHSTPMKSSSGGRGSSKPAVKKEKKEVKKEKKEVKKEPKAKPMSKAQELAAKRKELERAGGDKPAKKAKTGGGDKGFDDEEFTKAKMEDSDSDDDIPLAARKKL